MGCLLQILYMGSCKQFVSSTYYIILCCNFCNYSMRMQYRLFRWILILNRKQIRMKTKRYVYIPKLIMLFTPNWCKLITFNWVLLFWFRFVWFSWISFFSVSCIFMILWLLPYNQTSFNKRLRLFRFRVSDICYFFRFVLHREGPKLMITSL